MGVHETTFTHVYRKIHDKVKNAHCRKCGTDEETSAHILCKCEALASFRYTHLGSFLLDPEGIRELGTGDIWSFGKGTGLL
jgi:hypothetical protein